MPLEKKNQKIRRCFGCGEPLKPGEKTFCKKCRRVPGHGESADPIEQAIDMVGEADERQPKTREALGTALQNLQTALSDKIQQYEEFASVTVDPKGARKLQVVFTLGPGYENKVFYRWDPEGPVIELPIAYNAKQGYKYFPFSQRLKSKTKRSAYSTQTGIHWKDVEPERLAKPVITTSADELADVLVKDALDNLVGEMDVDSWNEILKGESQDPIEQAIDMVMEQEGDWIIVGFHSSDPHEVFEPGPIVDLLGPLTREQFVKEVDKYLKHPDFKKKPGYGPYKPIPHTTGEPYWGRFPSAEGMMMASNDGGSYFFAGPRKYVMDVYNHSKKFDEMPPWYHDFEVLFPEMWPPKRH